MSTQAVNVPGDQGPFEDYLEVPSRARTQSARSIVLLDHFSRMLREGIYFGNAHSTTLLSTSSAKGAGPAAMPLHG